MYAGSFVVDIRSISFSFTRRRLPAVAVYGTISPRVLFDTRKTRECKGLDGGLSFVPSLQSPILLVNTRLAVPLCAHNAGLTPKQKTLLYCLLLLYDYYDYDYYAPLPIYGTK
ncbi:hypothetical protein QTP88_022608 [Uroleucon formosanum]